MRLTEKESDLFHSVVDKLDVSRGDVLRVSPLEFQSFVYAMEAKVEIDEQGEFVTAHTKRGVVRVEPIATAVPPPGVAPR